jgi:sphinganine-1-phosphate aldolase
MEEIKSILSLIETSKNTFLSLALPDDYKQYIDFVDNLLSQYNQLLLFIIILVSLKFFNFFLCNFYMLFHIETYTTLFFYMFGNCFFLKSRLLKERKKMYQITMEGMNIDANDLKIDVKQNSQDIVRILKIFQDIYNKDKDHFTKHKQTGCLYTDNADLNSIAEKAAELYSHNNANYPELYTSVKKIEANLIDIMINLFHGDEKSTGLATTGGTESLMNLMYIAKQIAHKKNIQYPEVIAPITIHAAVDKGCSTYGLKLVKVNLDNNYKMSISEVKKHINSNTVCLIGSAINFPHGVIDDIDILGQIALKNDLMLHVDACMGGFVTCFYDEFLKDWKKLDFRVEGVTSISCDIHKYGMTQKGSSILMFKDKSLRKYLNIGLIGDDGLTLSNGLMDTRSSFFIVSAYMTLIYNGKKIYIDQAKRIYYVMQKLKSDLQKFHNISLIGDPEVSIFAIKGERIGPIHNEMKKKGWAANLVNMPLGMAFCITSINISEFENGKFIEDFKNSYDYVYKNNIKEQSGLAAMYGVASMLPESILNKNMDVVLDGILDTKESLKYVLSKDLDNKK